VKDIAAVMKFAKSMPDSTGKVGVMGYCLGGLMTYLVSARYGSDASVAYYPGGADQYVDEASSVSSPIIIHLAEEDEFIPKQAQTKILDAFANSPNAHIYSYAGQDHAFARHTGAHYDAEAAARANGRTWEFLRSQLK
jgi:carboxymethylenebutenolidase